MNACPPFAFYGSSAPIVGGAAVAVTRIDVTMEMTVIPVVAAVSHTDHET